MADGYNFAADLLTTWRSTADWVKAMGVTAFGITTIALVNAWLDYRLRRYELTLADKHHTPPVEGAAHLSPHPALTRRPLPHGRGEAPHGKGEERVGTALPKMVGRSGWGAAD
ncbi:hypothetical protein H2509_09765 [Stappia sp. F7233]|uniref:Uncharacterized protein n=1 Tax=Stappia albiluteola TaxID=2758565 RepID=A0A839AEN6_9HYPH|nr:hypothetical protein [Stappia albiluteola]MBA5777414.1 hypothetical protein [Stappia albiluteola]